MLLFLWCYFVALFCLHEDLICKFSGCLLQRNLPFLLIILLNEDEETCYYKNIELIVLMYLLKFYKASYNLPRFFF